MAHDTQKIYNMHNTDSVAGTVLMSVLAVASGLFGFLEHLDLFMGVLAKVIAIFAGCASLMIAYQTYFINKDKIEEAEAQDKPPKKTKRL